MKKRSALSILLTCLAGLIFLSCKRDFDFPRDNTYRQDSGRYKSRSSLAYIESTKYKANQIIVAWKKPPTAGQIAIIRQAFSNLGINSISIRKCNSCKDPYVELWQALNIETVISGGGVTAGSTTRPKGVGEDSLAYYSLNFITYSIKDTLTKPLYKVQPIKPVVFTKAKTPIVVAVIDTGIDTALVNKDHLWRNASPSGCYGQKDINGWNFTLNNRPNIDNGNVHDDNMSRHGTTVSQFIINEFTQSTSNYVRLMILKTLNKDGGGDLFSNICAIHYAMNNGARIINASWGFYYQDTIFRYFDSLVTKILPRKGILFVAAAGNQMELADRDAIALGITALRDLDKHRFYPACLSKANNNVVTVTTAIETPVSLRDPLVSPTQNYSSLFVDLGIRPDTEPDGMMFTFKVPYPLVVNSGRMEFISGSSFATAIATGIIGSNLNQASYVPGLNKANVFKQLLEKSKVKSYESLKLKYIRNGYLSSHTSNGTLNIPPNSQ